MKTFFSKISGIAAIALILQTPGFAQDEKPEKTEKTEKTEKNEKYKKLENHDEIVIRKKSDKDTKVTLEIKDGQVYVNGKPIEDFEDDNIAIQKKKVPFYSYNFSDDESVVAGSPFRSGSWSYSDDFPGAAGSKKGFLGVTTDREGEEGVIIREVNKGSAAEKAGLKKDDIITKIDETKIEDPDDLTTVIRKHKPEEKVQVTFKRDGKEQKVTATLGKMHTVAYSFSTPTPMGDLGGMGGMNRRNFIAPPGGDNFFVWNGQPRFGIRAQDTDDGKGVKVLDVDDESPAQKAGIKEGDVITTFDGKEVNSADQLSAQAKLAKTKATVKVSFLRDGKKQDVDVRTPRKLKTTDL